MKYLDYAQSIFSGCLVMSFMLGSDLWKLALPILVFIYWLKMFDSRK